MAKIIYTTAFTGALSELAKVLYKRGYFGFFESCEEYVNKIYDFIDDNLPIEALHQKTPVQLFYFGSEYLIFKSSGRTTWYMFFLRKGDNYLVTHIFNNHSPEAALLRT